MTHKAADLSGIQQAFPYPRSTSGATTDLGREIISEISKNGPISFRRYMELCLYHPELGYYSRPDANTVSRHGDFITSVSVGPLFGKLLALRLHRFWLSNGSPSSFTVLELGAHDGSLARDIITASAQIDPIFSKALSYFISEPLPARRTLLKSRLRDQAIIIKHPDELRCQIGALVANEVLDALPLPLLFFSQKQWHEILVSAKGNSLTWDTQPSSCNLPHHYPEAYLTEGSPDFEQLLSPLSKCFQKALFLWIDYGLDEASLYHPARCAGTLRCYRKHRADAHPLDAPGEQDLTADVNFTAVEKAASRVGLQPHPVMAQSRYLTYCAKDWLHSKPSAKEISQFQTLTHPSQFGNRFYTLELTKGVQNHIFP